MRLETGALLRLISLTVLGLFLMASSAFSSPGQRVALVIGISNHQNVPQLPAPDRDADLVAELFRSEAFDTVLVKQDLGIADMRRAIREFTRIAGDADIALVYYAGQRIQVDGANDLIPADAQLQSDFDIEDATLSLDRMHRAVEPARRLCLIILDACRDNPFSKFIKRTLAIRGIGNGLAKVDPTTSDTLIAFAAKAGAVANDGDAGLGPFALALVKHLAEPGLDLRIAFGRARDGVLQTTSYHQEPFVYGSLSGDTVVLAQKNHQDAGPKRQGARRFRVDRAGRHQRRIECLSRAASARPLRGSGRGADEQIDRRRVVAREG